MKNHPIINLVQQISGKIQNKLSSGEVSESDLLSEAKGALNILGKGSGNDNNPLGMLKGLVDGLKFDNTESLSKKEILREKLRKKRKKIDEKIKLKHK